MKGRTIYLTCQEITMIKTALFTEISKMHASYEKDGEECNLHWMERYRALKDDKFYYHWKK